jgi:hypothetical protein
MEDLPVTEITTPHKLCNKQIRIGLRIRHSVPSRIWSWQTDEIHQTRKYQAELWNTRAAGSSKRMIKCTNCNSAFTTEKFGIKLSFKQNFSVITTEKIIRKELLASQKANNSQT